MLRNNTYSINMFLKNMTILCFLLLLAPITQAGEQANVTTEQSQAYQTIDDVFVGRAYQGRYASSMPTQSAIIAAINREQERKSNILYILEDNPRLIYLLALLLVLVVRFWSSDE